MAPIIMIVDDDLDDMEITRRALVNARCGIILMTALRGETALALLSNSAELPSLMFIDLKMPGMSGIDTLRLIRADERLKHIPVVLVTNSTLESDRKAAIDAGANGYLHKDFDLDHFGRDIQSQLECWIKD